MEIKSVERILDDNEVSLITSLSRSTRWRLQRKGEFPFPVKLTFGRVGYRLSDVLEWVQSRPSTSAITNDRTRKGTKRK